MRLRLWLIILLLAGLALPAAPSSLFAQRPTVTPPPTAASTDCPDTPARRLILHERGRVLPDDPRPLNLRAAPGTGADNRVLRLIPIRAIFYVLDGPVCANTYQWFQIELNGQEGWIAEGDLTSYFVEPYLPG